MFDNQWNKFLLRQTNHPSSTELRFNQETTALKEYMLSCQATNVTSRSHKVHVQSAILQYYNICCDLPFLCQVASWLADVSWCTQRKQQELHPFQHSCSRTQHHRGDLSHCLYCSLMLSVFRRRYQYICLHLAVPVLVRSWIQCCVCVTGCYIKENNRENESDERGEFINYNK